jgi:hypothetical protein
VASRRTKVWIGVTIGGALLALALVAVVNRREIRDAWRVSRVKAHPDYPKLKARWQKIAKAVEEMHWPRERAKRAVPQLLLKAKISSNWRGTSGFVSELREMTDRAEMLARRDFSRICIDHGLLASHQHDDRAFRELARMRERGELSDGTFSRAMLILVRDNSSFLHHKSPGALRSAMRGFCGVIDDGGPRLARRTAGDLEEAIADAARSRRAAVLCSRWKRREYRRSDLRGHYHLIAKLIKKASPVHERIAYERLSELSRAVPGTLRPALAPADNDGAVWSQSFPSSLDEALGDPGRESALSGRIRHEAARLPKGQRARLAAVAMMTMPGPTGYRMKRRISSGRFSPRLRLIAEIIRNNP